MRLIPFKRRRRSWRGVSPHNLGTAVFVVLAACADYASLPGGAVGTASGGGDTFTGQVTGLSTATPSRSARRKSASASGVSMPPEADQPGGSRATAALAGLISGQQLTCRQRDVDRYGRIVGQCFLPDGRDITAAMLASGTAQEYCRYSGNHYRTC